MGSCGELTGHPDSFVSFSILIILQKNDSKILLVPPISLIKGIIAFIALTNFCCEIHAHVEPKLYLKMDFIVSLFLPGCLASTAN